MLWVAVAHTLIVKALGHFFPDLFFILTSSFVFFHLPRLNSKPTIQVNESRKDFKSHNTNDLCMDFFAKRLFAL